MSKVWSDRVFSFLALNIYRNYPFKRPPTPKYLYSIFVKYSEYLSCSTPKTAVFSTFVNKYLNTRTNT